MFLKRGTLILCLALAISGAGQILSAQMGPVGGGLRLNGVGPRLGENVQMALEARDELGLTEDQMARLQELAAGIQEEVSPLETEIAGLQRQILAGEVDYVPSIRRLQDLHLQYDEVAAPYRTGVTSILSVDQHRVLQSIMFDTWPGTRGVWSGRGVGLGRGAAYWGGRGYGAGYGAGRGFARGAGRGFSRAGRGNNRWWRNEG